MTILRVLLIPIAILSLGMTRENCATAAGGVGIKVKDFSTNPDVAYESETGLPLTVPIIFSSDIEINQASPGTLGTLWAVWSLSESPNDGYYDAVSDSTANVAFSATAAGTEDGVVTFTLSRTALVPEGVGTFTFTLTVKLMYQNTEDLDMLMYQKDYQIEVQRQGEGVYDYVLATTEGAATTESFTAPEGTKAGPSVAVPSSPTSLQLVPTGGPFTYPDPIVLVASSSEPSYKVWFSTLTSVHIYSDAAMTDLKYVWPSMFVASSTTVEDTEAVTITLNLVPEGIYDLGTVYISLKVNFRDTAGGRRSLRGLSTVDSPGAASGTSLVAKVDMLPMGASASAKTPLWTISVAAIAGAVAALLL